MLDWAFIYIHSLCVLVAKALMRLQGCAGSSEPRLLADLVSTEILCIGPYSDT